MGLKCPNKSPHNSKQHAGGGTNCGTSPAETRTQKKSIAILPLDNRSDDPKNEYLCDGISEELITGLSRVTGLRVASQLESFRFKNRDSHLREMGSELSVDTILSGSVKKAGNRVRVTVRLDEVRGARHLWSEKYNGTVDDMFELQDDVARQVIEALKVEFAAHQQEPLVDVGTKNPAAYDIFLAGRHEKRKHTRRDVEQAIDLFQQAMELDPGFGRASFQLHDCYVQLMNVFDLPREQLVSKAEEAADHARKAGFVPSIPWIAVYRIINPQTKPSQRQLVVEACEKIRNPDPEWGPFTHLQLGECLAAAGLFNGAAHFLETYVKTGDDGFARHLLGYTLECLARIAHQARDQSSAMA
jgi:TolB-like protein